MSKLHEPRLLPGVCGVLPRPRFVSPPNSWSLTPGVQPCAELLQEPFPLSLVPVRGCAAMRAVRPCWLGLCESWRQHLVFHYGLPAPPPPRPMKPRVAHWPGAPHSRAWHSVGVPLSGGRLGDLRKDGFHSQFLHRVAVSTCTSEGQVPGLTSPVK